MALPTCLRNSASAARCVSVSRSFGHDPVLAVGDLGRAAIAVIDRDHLLDVVQLDRGREIVPERLVPVLERRATTPIAAPAKTNWLYLPVSPGRAVYLVTGSCRRGSMQPSTIAS